MVVRSRSPPRTQPDSIGRSESDLEERSPHFHFHSKYQKKKKNQYKCEYIFNTKRISNTHWVYVKIYIKHFLQKLNILRKAHHFGITPTFVPSFTKFIRVFNIKNIYKIESEFRRIFTSPLNGFEVGSVLVRSSLLYLFTRYLHVDKNNILSIFMLSGSIQFYSLFISF